MDPRRPFPKIVLIKRIEQFWSHSGLLFASCCALILAVGALTPRWRVVSRDETIASWYGVPFHGRTTASGETYNMLQMTAAHRRLPFGTRVRVTDLETGRAVLVTINDRGPYRMDEEGRAIFPLQPHPSRDIDLSFRAARRLGTLRRGVARVSLEVLEPVFP